MCDGGGSHSCDSSTVIAETSNSLSDSSKNARGFNPTREQRVAFSVALAIVGGTFILISIVAHFFL